MIDKLIEREANLRAANSLFHVWQAPKRMVMEEMAAATAASDAKAARLKALRLEKERQDAEVGVANPVTTPVRKRALLRINID